VWGHSDSGALGLGDLKPRSVPTLVSAVGKQGCSAPLELTEVSGAETANAQSTGVGVGLNVTGMPFVPPALALASAALIAHGQPSSLSVDGANVSGGSGVSGCNGSFGGSCAETDGPVGSGCMCGVMDVECVGNHTVLLTYDGLCLSTEQGNGFSPRK